MLSDSNERMDSLSLLMYMAPVAVVALIPTTLFFEPDAAALAMQLGKDGCEWPGLGGRACCVCHAQLPDAWALRALHLSILHHLRAPALCCPCSLLGPAVPQLLPGLLCQPDQLPGHQAHQRTDAAGARGWLWQAQQCARGSCAAGQPALLQRCRLLTTSTQLMVWLMLLMGT